MVVDLDGGSKDVLLYENLLSYCFVWFSISFCFKMKQLKCYQVSTDEDCYYYYWIHSFTAESDSLQTAISQFVYCFYSFVCDRSFKFLNMHVYWHELFIVFSHLFSLYVFASLP